MKVTVFALLLASTLPAFAREKPYPLQFQVLSADRVPGDFGRIGSCSMLLWADNRIYTVAIEDTFHPCTVFPRGTTLRGREDHGISESVELIDETGSKAKKLRYFVRDVEMR